MSKTKDISDYVIYYLGQSYICEQNYAETGKMMWKSAWLHCIKFGDKALLTLMSLIERKNHE